MNRRRLIVLAFLTLTTVCAPTLAAATATTDHGVIAFSARVHGISQVFTVRPDGTGLRQVTHGPLPAGENGLSWSPDGRGLLFTVFEGGGGDKIFKSRADGSGVTLISPPCTGDCLGDDNPVYSPDGKKIAFERAFGPIVNNNASVVAIFTMNADGSDLTQLTQTSTPTSTEDHQPRWSPDGTKIAFVRINDTALPSNEGAIEVMNSDGSNLRRLTPFWIDASDPRWSPDGKRLLFNSYAEPIQGGSANLFIMRADGTHRVALTHYAGGTLQAFADDWSPDGMQIVYRRLAFSGTDTEVGGFYILDIRSRHIRRLTPVRIRYDAQAAWGN
jgi:Tol biopolymer transport system component